MPDIIISPQVTQVSISQTGTQGPPGPIGATGPQGPAGNSSLFLMNDVTITGPANNQFLKFNGSTWTNVNTETIDGGNW